MIKNCVIGLLLIICSVASFADEIFPEDCALVEILAGNGNVKAQNQLGIMYSDGVACEKNQATGAGWFVKAAKSGDARAISNLGWSFDKAEGVVENKALAFALYEYAAFKGDLVATQLRLDILDRISPTQKSQGEAIFVRLKKGAAITDFIGSVN